MPSPAHVCVGEVVVTSYIQLHYTIMPPLIIPMKKKKKTDVPVMQQQLKETFQRLESNDASLIIKVVIDCTSRSVQVDTIMFPDEMKQFAHVMKKNTSTTKLTIRNLSMGLAFAQQLSEVIIHNKTLTSLTLQDLRITHPEAILVIIKALQQNTTLEHVQLQAIGMELTTEIASSLASMLETNTLLKTLGLAHNTMNSSVEAVGVLSRALSCSTTFLRMLDLENTALDDECIVEIASGLLHSNTCLERLCLDFNTIGDKGAEALATMLQHNTALQDLQLFGNHIGDAGAVALAHSLRTGNTTLRKLNLASNQLTHTAIQTFGTLLPNMQGLKELNLGENTKFVDSNDESSKCILNGLCQNVVLETLHFPSDTNSDDIVSEIQYLLLCNKAGRRILREEHVVMDGLWPLILERAAANNYCRRQDKDGDDSSMPPPPNGLYFLLCEKPELASHAGNGGGYALDSR